MKNILIAIIIVWAGQITAQTSLSGKVLDEETGEPLLFANISVMQNGNHVTGATTDFDGFYNIANIDPGTYDVEASYSGYTAQRIAGVVIYGEQTNNVDFKLSSGVTLQDVVVTAYKIPLIKQDETTSGSILTSNQLKKLPTRTIGSINNNAAGISAGDKSDNVYMKGSRNPTTFYMVDGIRVQGNLLPNEASPPPPKPSTTGEEYGKFVENSVIEVAQENTSTFSIDVDKASYSLIRRDILKYNQKPAPDAVRIEEMINYFDYDYEQPTGDEPFSIYSATARCPWTPENILLHIGIKGKELDMADAAPSNLVFLIDVSGSMASNDKLGLLKPAFKLLVEKLRPEDKVAIVVYAGSSGLVLPSTSAGNKKTILKALENLEAGGGTAGEAGIRLAYQTARDNFIKEGNNRVILATDGDFNVGISSPQGLETLIEEKRKEGIYLTTLGFGAGNYKDNRMETLADKGNGNYAYIDNLKEAKKVFITELTGTLYTIAKDVKIQIEFDEAFVENYRLVGYENRLLAKEDFHDDTKDAGELGAGHTVTALYELKLKQPAPEEILKLKLRYKLPDQSQSRYIESFTTGDAPAFAAADNNLRFAATVAGFGMLLRDSKYAGHLSYDKISKYASKAIGKDKNGYRKEFLKMVKAVQKTETVASK